MEDIVQETTNEFDSFAVHSSKKDSIVVRHMPRKFAAICSLFFTKTWHHFLCQIVSA